MWTPKGADAVDATHRRAANAFDATHRRIGAARMDSPQVLRAGTRLTTEDQEGIRSPRRVLVTGANRGLGLEIVKALLERDDVDKVYLGCRDFEAGTASAAGNCGTLAATGARPSS